MFYKRQVYYRSSRLNCQPRSIFNTRCLLTEACSPRFFPPRFLSFLSASGADDDTDDPPVGLM